MTGRGEQLNASAPPAGRVAEVLLDASAGAGGTGRGRAANLPDGDALRGRPRPVADVGPDASHLVAATPRDPSHLEDATGGRRRDASPLQPAAAPTLPAPSSSFRVTAKRGRVAAVRGAR